MGSGHMTAPVHGRAAAAVLMGRVHGRRAGQAEGPQLFTDTPLLSLGENVAEAQRDRQGQQRHHVTRARPHALVPRHLTVSGCVPRRRFNSTHGSFDSSLNRTSLLAKSAGKS